MALPSKGHMELATLAFLEGCGMRVNKTNPRQYSARIPALPQVLVLFQRAWDIPRSVAAGDIDLGITGLDALAETLDPAQREVVLIHEALGYGACDLVTAVPTDWRDVTSMAALAARARQMGGLRAATKYPNAARRFFDQHRLEGIEIVSSDGALEAAPAIGYADFIIDISETGTTLRENNLKTLEDGTLIRSQAVLIGSRRALESHPDVLAVTYHLLEFIEAHLRARGQYLVFANMRGESREEIAARIFDQTDLGGLQGPTIAPIISQDTRNGWWAINIVVSTDRLYSAIQQIRAIGGSGVVATPAAYIFEERPERYQRLLAELGKD
ncbi:MAG: ATP phosphoribosyltransferase [Anaerolineae bacterium]